MKPAVPSSVPRDFKSPCLQSALQGKAGEEADGQPPAKRKKIDLIFKDVLEASLEDSGRSRTRSSSHPECKTAPGAESFSVPNLKVEEKEEESPAREEPSTSFCPNCVKLKRRILELEEELTRLRGEPAARPSNEPVQHQHDQAPPHPEQGPIEDFQGG